MLEVKNLSKRYGEKQALRSVSFSIQGREAVGFLASTVRARPGR